MSFLEYSPDCTSKSTISFIGLSFKIKVNWAFPIVHLMIYKYSSCDFDKKIIKVLLARSHDGAVTRWRLCKFKNSSKSVHNENEKKKYIRNANGLMLCWFFNGFVFHL